MLTMMSTALLEDDSFSKYICTVSNVDVNKKSSISVPKSSAERMPLKHTWLDF